MAEDILPKPKRNRKFEWRRLSPEARERAKARRREWYKANPEWMREYLRKWKKEHPDYYREDYAKNIERYRTSKRKTENNYSPERKAEIAAYRKAWHAAHPERMNEIKAKNARKRRAQKMGSGGTFSQQDIAEIFDAQKGKCGYCRKSIKKKYHVDHIIALAKGGSNDRKNIQLLCPSCNRRKSAKDPIEFAQQIGLLI